MTELGYSMWDRERLGAHSGTHLCGGVALTRREILQKKGKRKGTIDDMG